MKENNEGDGETNNDDESVEDVNVEKEMAEKKGPSKYKSKIQEMRKYIPALRRIMENWDPAECSEAQNLARKRLESVYQMIEDPKKEKGLKYESLLKLEGILTTILTKIKAKKARGNGPPPTLRSLLLDEVDGSQSMDTNKMDPSSNKMKNKGSATTSASGKSVERHKMDKQIEKVPHCSFRNKKDTDYFNISEPLFTPDRNVIKVRASTSQDYDSHLHSKRFSESGTYRPRFPHPESETRHVSFRVERHRAPFPFTEQRLRAPSFKTADRFKAPAPYSVSRFRPYGETRFRAPPSYSEERVRAPSSYSEERLRAPVPYSEERFRHPLSHDERCRAPLKEESYRPSHSDSKERSRPAYIDNKERFRHPSSHSTERYRFDALQTHKPSFTDEEERFYEKPKSLVKKVKREIADCKASSSKSTPHEELTTKHKKMRNQHLESTVTSKGKLIKRDIHSSLSSISSTEMDFGSPTLSTVSSEILEDPEDVRMQPKDLEKLTQSAQKLKSNLNNRLKNMHAQRRLKAHTNKEASITAAKNVEKSGGHKEKETTQEKNTKSEEPSKEPTNELADAFIDNIMSNLTTKFGFKRCPKISNEQDKNKNKHDTAAEPNKSNTPEGKELEKQVTNFQESNVNTLRVPFMLSTADKVTNPQESNLNTLTKPFMSSTEDNVTNLQESDVNTLRKPFMLSTEDKVTYPQESNVNTLRKPFILSTEDKETNPQESNVNTVRKPFVLSGEDKVTNLQEVNVNTVRTPIVPVNRWTAEDSAEVMSVVKQILHEKSKASSSSSTINSLSEKPEIVINLSDKDDDILKPPVNESSHEKPELQTSSNLTNNENTVHIPGLDGIIPHVVETNSFSFQDVLNKTKDDCLVTKGLVNQSSQENCVKSNSSEIEIGQEQKSIDAKIKFNSKENVGDTSKNNQKSNFNVNDNLEKPKPNQSLRSKLSGEITTLHKVGTPCGGALRGLVTRDKMMPPGQIASLKTGALLDIMDKPSRTISKAKTRPQSQLQIQSNPTHGHFNTSSEIFKTPSSSEAESSSVKSKNTDDILSKLSEIDLKKIITDNIGTLPTPPNLPFLNSVNVATSHVSSDLNSSSQGFSWTNQSSLMQINSQPQNLNDNIPPVDNFNNKASMNHQPVSNWVNNTQIKDPRRESQNIVSHVSILSHQSMESGQNVFSIPEGINSSFEKSTFSSNYARNPDPRDPNSQYYFNSFNQAVVLQTDPMKSPCYDGSTTPDPYRPDPYTMNLQGSFEKQGQVCNNLTDPINVYTRPPLLGDSPYETHANFTREVLQQPPLLRTPSLPSQRHALLGTPSLTQERDMYSNFSNNQQSQFNDLRHMRRGPATYAEWKAEKNKAEARKFHNFQSYDGQKYVDRATDDRRGFNRYRWTKETYDQRGRDSNNHSRDSSSRNQQKEPEVVKKLSARDPRRRSIEDNSERREILQSSTSYSKLESSNQDLGPRKSINFNKSTPPADNFNNKSNRKDRRSRDMTPPRGRSASRDHGHYRSRDGSSSKRGRSLSRGRSPTRGSDERNDKSKDTYSSPLDQLYTNTSVPKTGRGYGVQKFRIPKLNKSATDHSTKSNVKETSSEKKEELKNKNSCDVELKYQVTADDSAQKTESEEDNAIETNKNVQIENVSTEIENSKKLSDDKEKDSESENKQNSENEKVKALQHNMKSRNKNKSLCTDDSTEEDVEPSPCRRSKRLVKKSKGLNAMVGDLLPKAKSLRKQSEAPPKLETELKPSMNDTLNVEQPVTKGSSDNEKEQNLTEESTKTSIKENQITPNDALNSNADQQSLEVKGKEGGSDQTTSIPENSCSNSRVLSLESSANKCEDVCDSTSPSSFSDLTHKSTVKTYGDNVPTINPSSINDSLDEPYKIKLHTSKINSDDAEVVSSSALKSSSDSVTVDVCINNTLSFCDIQNQKHSKNLNTVTESSVLSADLKKESCDSVNKGTDIKLIKQVELLENVIGMKLTPDKIRKMAEILYAQDAKENTEKFKESIINEANETVQQSDIKSEEIKSEPDKKFSEVKTENLDEAKVLDKNEKKLETPTVSDTDDGHQEGQGSFKNKVLGKKKPNTRSKTPKNEVFEFKNTTQKPKRKYKNELDRLQDDISKYHDSEAIAAASGPRQCRLQKEKTLSIGKMPHSKLNQDTKKSKKNKEDEFYDSGDASTKRESIRTKDNDTEDSSIIEDESEDENGDGDTEEESVESKYSDSDSSDDLHLYNVKIKSKWGNEDTFNETNKKHVKENSEAELISSSVDAAEVESKKLVTNEENPVQDRNVEEKSGAQQTDDIKLENAKPNSSGESRDSLLLSSHQLKPTLEGIPKNLSDQKTSHGNEENLNNELSNNTSHKSGLKKPRKKSFWSAGIIRKKTKTKKTDSPTLSPSEDNSDAFEMDEDEDLMVSLAPDLNYYQEGDSKATKCKLCSFHGKSIVTHYAITHPKDEVLISRMSPNAAKIAVKESSLFFNLSDEKKKHYSSTFECRICYLKTPKFSNFFEHMALHTGEFRHECCKCGYRTSTRCGILKHYQTHNIKNVSNKSCRILYKEPVEKTFFCGYLCSLCNYIQINQNNVKLHVHNVHESQDISHVIKINFSKVSINESDANLSATDASSVNDMSGRIQTTSLDAKHIRESSTTSDFTEDGHHSSGNELPVETNDSSNVAVDKVTHGPSGRIIENNNPDLEESLDVHVGDSCKHNTIEPLKNSIGVAEQLKPIASVQEIGDHGEACSSPDITKNKACNLTEMATGVSSSNTNTVLISDLSSNENDDFKHSNESEDLQKSNKHEEDVSEILIENSGSNSIVKDSIPDAEKGQAPMLIQSDWFLCLCKNISDLNHQYLVETAKSSVSARVEELKSKAESLNIVEKVSQRWNSDLEDTLLLDDLLDSSFCFKMERTKRVSNEKQNETLCQNIEGEEEITRIRRQLPDRICKAGFTKQSSDKEKDSGIFSDDEEVVETYKIVKDPGDHENNWDDDIIVKEELSLDTSNDENFNFTIENSQVLPCLQAPIENYVKKIASRKPLSIEEKPYISSLPPNSNFSEFTHVMKQISQVSLKVSEIKEVKVGGLKALPIEGGVIFSCSVKIFNKECGYRTSELEEFGQHVNMLHHTSFWNGVCCACLVYFVRDPSSHDKFSINTQSKAFCHLVREHLTFTKKTTKSVSRGNVTVNEVPVSAPEEKPTPKIRVRRFSGDNLSGPAVPGNALAKPTFTGLSDSVNPERSVLCQGDSNLIDTCVRSTLPTSETHHETPGPTEDEINRGIKIFKSFYNSQGAKSTFKIERVYSAMCDHRKLRHLYKCMGAKCSFTTTSLKEFARHVEDHREIHVINPDEDTHKGFWNVCAYCLTAHGSSRELCIHIRKEHGICTMQCAHCFYRSKSIANVYFHHTVEHTNKKFIVLKCDQLEMNLPPIQEKPFTEFVSAFRCGLKANCALFTYMLHTFRVHVQTAHPNHLQCHMCMATYTNIDSLLKHFCDKHGIGLYQCLFCTFGAPTEDAIRLHLCYVHPNVDPKALQRTDNSKQQQNTGTTNRESIKRLMFYKDQEKLFKYIAPAEEDIALTHSNNPINVGINPESSNSEMSPQSVTNSLSPSDRTETEQSHMQEVDVTGRPDVNNRTHLQQAASAILTLGQPRFIKPAILRSKRPAGETSSPVKILITSPTSSNERVPLNIPSDSPIPGGSPSHSISTEITPVTNVVAMPVSSSIQRSSTDNSISYSTLSVDSDESTIQMDTSSSTESTNMTSVISSESNAPSNRTEQNVNYFRCGNKGCNFEANTSTPLKNHLVICDQARQSQKLSCPFCNRVFKQVGSFVEHLKGHGPERYSCSICGFKASLLAKVNSHMKVVHHISTTTITPVDISKQDADKDYFIVSGKEKRKGEKPGPKGKSNRETKTKFTPEELDEVPKPAIFMNPLGCRLCTYMSKVRSNLVRHLQLHLSGDRVNQEEVVNPVPEKAEKMFDKMMNLAGSSHKKKSGPDGKDETPVVCMYKYVPDQDRYMCHVGECGYRTLSETMLRDHISVIHKDETHYMCPHCEDDSALPIPIDQLGMHLKLHDSPVFKCAYCDFCSHIRRSIERHTEILHFGEPVDVQTVRLTKPDQASDQPAPKFHPTDRSDEQGEEMYCCNHCFFKSKKKKLMLQHGATEHKMMKPFKCSACGYESLTEQILRDHLHTYHSDQNCELIALYKRVTEMKKIVLQSMAPLWRRDAKKLKLIRGIKLDEKGDAPPPVATATTGIEGLDVLELKFGHFGKPLGTHYMCPRCATSFITKNRQEMKEHLFKDLEYSPIICKICKMGSTQRTKVMKHINKQHNVEWERISEFIEINQNEELENWIEKVLERQQSMMAEVVTSTAVESSSEPPRKRRRSSVEASGPPPPPTPELPTSPPSAPIVEDPVIMESLVLNEESNHSSSDEQRNNEKRDDQRIRERRRRDKCPSRHRISRFSCEYCGVTTKYKHSIVLHSKKFHPDLPPKVNLIEKAMEETTEAFNCMYCNCTALNLNTLKHHWSYTHKNSGLNFLFRNTTFNTDLEYECYWCNKRTDLETLEEHCRDDHSPEQRFLVVSVSVPKYKCSECNLVFKSVDILKRHFAMAHPSKKFCYIVINTQRPASTSDQSPISSNSPETPPKPKSSFSFKCFNCPFVSPKFGPMVKHMHRHFISFVCSECESVFPTESGLSNHMLGKHPLSSAKPHVLRGSETDIENAKKNLIIILESGESRKITEEELMEAENENRPEGEDTNVYTYDEPVVVQMSPPIIRETARKSTGSPKYSTPPKQTSSMVENTQKSPSSVKKTLFKIKRKKKLADTFITVRSHNKVIKLPAETFRKLINFEPKIKLTNNVI